MDIARSTRERPQGARGIREHVVEIICENLDALDRGRPSARMRILLTGGAGFIGSHVAERLASRHPEYTVRARFRPRVYSSNNARTLHPSLARTTDRERLVALDRLSSWTSSTIARA